MKHDDTPPAGRPDDGPDRSSSRRAPGREVPDPVPGPVARGTACRVELERAWLELVRVHELEQARLLREACRLRRAHDLSATAVADERSCADEWRLAFWRRRAEEALALALVDALEPLACLRFCAAHAVRRWPSAEELARASLMLDDCASGRRLVHG